MRRFPLPPLLALPPHQFLLYIVFIIIIMIIFICLSLSTVLIFSFNILPQNFSDTPFLLASNTLHILVLSDLFFEQ